MKEASGCPDALWMHMALAEARNSRTRGDLGVGAVIVGDNKVLALGGNRVLSSGDVTAHAEMVAIRQLAADAVRGCKTLTLYATFEPCPMCAAAALVAGVRHLVIGATRDPSDRTWGSYKPSDLGRFTRDGPTSWQVESGLLRDECLALRGGADGDGTHTSIPH